MGRTATASDDQRFVVAVHVPTIHFSGNSAKKLHCGNVCYLPIIDKIMLMFFCCYVASDRDENAATLDEIARLLRQSALSSSAGSRSTTQSQVRSAYLLLPRTL